MSSLRSVPAAYQDAQAQWSALAARLAARGRVRISRDGGRNYRLRDERLVPEQLPSQPAAVLLYDSNGCAPVFVVDLDSRKGERPAQGRAGVDQVDEDLAALTAMLERCGLTSWVSDHSPNGGRHVYVPLVEPAPFAEAAQAARALAERLTTVDPQPMLGLSSGCIRPPGARHKSGGHQALDGPLAAAEEAFDLPNDRLAWKRFLAELDRGRKPLPVPDDATSSLAPAAIENAVQLDALPGYREPSEDFQRIARTGEYDPTRYKSASDARQGVLWGFCAAGWALTDVVRRLEDGTYPGLASFYTKYRPGHRHRALAHDWHHAAAFEKRRREKHRHEAQGEKSVRVHTTSPLKTRRGEQEGERKNAPTGGAERRTGDVGPWVREWLVAVDLLHGRNGDPAVRAVLYALAQAASLSGRVEVEQGNRFLAIGAAADQSHVGRILKKLAAEPSDRLLVDLVEVGRGINAHVYQLIIPPLLAPACAAKPWRGGRIHAIRPAFRELGRVAAFVYAALEQHHHEHSKGRAGATIGGRELAEAAGVGVTAAYDALAALSTWGLAQRSPAGGWHLGPASLGQLAEAWGIVDAVRAQLARYRAERLAWWEWLIAHGLLSPDHLERRGHLRPAPPPAPPPPQPWYRDTDTLVDLLHNELGAQLVDAS